MLVKEKVLATALPLPPDVTPYFIVFDVYNDSDGELIGGVT